ncbi:unnamed protein product [Allacma fusca]|uniref:Cytochrome P450 n=1 Tax=Allacma fusca TaxID=39272 RepID=A0A8J2PGF5_9HEXA|nr:unnamed protein product [Allacma fusca]
MSLSNPSDIEKLLTSSVCTEKGETYKFIMPWLGEGLLTSSGKKWQKRRKMITPAFHFKILEDFLVIFNEQANILVEILREDFLNGEEKDICEYVTRCTLDIIGETAMDRRIDSQRNKDTPYVMAVTKACEIMLHRATRPLLWPYFVFSLTPSGREYQKSLKILHDFTTMVIKERKKSQLAEAHAKASEVVTNIETDEIYWHGKRRLAFLDLLLDAQKNPENELTDTDIREEVDTFMFEGHDTTAASLNWTIFLLGCNQHCQAKVHEELDRIFGDDRSRHVTTKDLAEMKYLELCIKEALRLYPSVPFLARYLNSDLTLDKDIVIPAGVNVCLMSMSIHRNETIYPEPEAFIPERFLPENCANRHPFAYIPFSAGPRNCIGQKFAMMEEKVVLAQLFRNYKVEAAERREDVAVMIEVVTRPRDGLKIRLSPR